MDASTITVFITAKVLYVSREQDVFVSLNSFNFKLDKSLGGEDVSVSLRTVLTTVY